jgi:DNA-binding IclR family transcriptional regulator
MADFPPGVGLLSKVFQILDLFTADRPTWSQAELVKETCLPRSTVSRLIRYLCSRGYLIFLERQMRYGLGFAAVQLGQRALAQFDLVEVSVPVLERLSKRTGETIILTGYQETARRVVCLEQIPSTRGGLRVFETVGATFPLYAGASSKAVLGRLANHQVEALLTEPLPRINREVGISAASLRRDIVATRKRGYAVSFEETYPGVTGVAAAIADPQGRPVGSIAIAGPMQRVGADQIAEYGVLLMEAVAEIEQILGRPGTEEAVPARRGAAQRRSTMVAERGTR